MSMVVYKMFHHLLLDLEFYAFALKNKAIKAEVLGDKKYSYSFLIQDFFWPNRQSFYIFTNLYFSLYNKIYHEIKIIINFKNFMEKGFFLCFYGFAKIIVILISFL